MDQIDVTAYKMYRPTLNKSWTNRQYSRFRYDNMLFGVSVMSNDTLSV